MSGITTEINQFTNNKFVVRFTNLVNMTEFELDEHILNNYIKSITVPNISIPMLESKFMHERQLHPNPIGARELQTVNIEFIMDERMRNYYLLYSWIYYMRYGRTCGKKSLKGDELLRMDCIDAIEFVSLNNDNKIISKMKFKHAIITDIGSWNGTYGSAEVVTFSATFNYETVELLLEDTEDIDGKSQSTLIL